jgi:formamidase
MLCRPAAMAGWIDLRVNLTKRGVERFHVNGPIVVPATDPYCCR